LEEPNAMPIPRPPDGCCNGVIDVLESIAGERLIDEAMRPKPLRRHSPEPKFASDTVGRMRTLITRWIAKVSAGPPRNSWPSQRFAAVALWTLLNTGPRLKSRLSTKKSRAYFQARYLRRA
jgi:hypothetical protein